MSLRGGFSREEFGRALGLGELLVLAALLVLAPVVRGEVAYGSLHSFLPRVLAGEGYFLLMLAFLGMIVTVRVLVTRRLSVPEPVALALLAGLVLYVTVRGAFSDHPYEAGRETTAWLANLLVFALVLISAELSRRRAVLLAAVAASLAVQGYQALYQYYVTLPDMRRLVRLGIDQPGIDAQNPMAVSRLLSGEPFNTFLHANALGGWMVSAALAAAGLAAALLVARAARPAADGEPRGPSPLWALLAGLALAELCVCLWLPARGGIVTGQAGHWLCLAGSAAALVLCLAAGRRARLPGRVLLVAGWLPVAVLVVWTLVLTGAKGAYVALAAAPAVALLVAPPAAGRAGRQLRLGGGVILAGLVAAALALWLVPGLPGRAGLAASLQVRLGYWVPAACMAGGNPLFGVGPGKFGALYPQLKGPVAEETQSAHSAYMETAAEEGLLGLALLVAFWGFVIWRLIGQVAAAPAGGGEDGASGSHDRSDPPDPDGAKRAPVVLAAGALATAAGARMVLEGITWPALGTLAVIWGSCFLLVCRPLAAPSPAAGGRGGERLLAWGLLAALAAFLTHSAGSMGMSLRSLIGPALILAALGMAGPGRREWTLSGRTALAAAAVLAAAVICSAHLGAREWSRGAAFAEIEAAAAGGLSGGPGERRLTPRERKLLLARMVEEALAGDPDNWQLCLKAGGACVAASAHALGDEERRRFLEEAEAYYRRAVQLAPARSTAQRALARFFVFWKEKVPLAPGQYARLMELYPLKAEYAVEAGDAELLAGRPAKAVDLYRRALETSRRVGDEAIHLSILFENRDRLDWQRFVLEPLTAELDAFLAGNPESAPALFRRALVAVVADDFPTAAALLERAARAEPDDAQLLLFVGYAQRLDGRWQKALETFRDAATLEARSSARPAGPGAVRRALYRTALARDLAARRGRVLAGKELPAK